ncbi:cation:proton antiporter [Trujillonella humicola]|uniref:cation:proton antiporter n=1 Tax=Trujillonella humicola TaxID=3383699 RepID=UPI0039060495
MTDAVAVLLLTAGALFFTAGTVGILRFPDTASRLHALTKADNVGLGLLLAGLAVLAGPAVAPKLGLIWLLVLLSSTTTAQLLAAREAGLEERR